MSTRPNFLMTAPALVVPSKCPTCGRTLVSASGLSGRRVPVAGDMTICRRCGGVAKFVAAGDMGVTARPLSDEERALVDADPKLSLVRHALVERGVTRAPARKSHQYRGRA